MTFKLLKIGQTLFLAYIMHFCVCLHIICLTGKKVKNDSRKVYIANSVFDKLGTVKLPKQSLTHLLLNSNTDFSGIIRGHCILCKRSVIHLTLKELNYSY